MGYRYRNIQDTDRTQQRLRSRDVVAQRGQKIQKEVAGAFSTVLDSQMAKGCTKAEAIATGWTTSWPN
jgi:hypothetical protein